MDVRLALLPSRASSPVAASRPVRTEVLPSRDARPSAPVEPERGGRVSTWSILALSTGAAALGTALVFEILRKNTEDDARNASQADYVALVREMETQQTISRVFLGVGAALTIAGGIKLGFDLKDDGRSQRRVGISSCGRIGICGAVQGQF
jgi:hypothetical protein